MSPSICAHAQADSVCDLPSSPMLDREMCSSSNGLWLLKAPAMACAPSTPRGFSSSLSTCKLLLLAIASVRLAIPAPVMPQSRRSKCAKELLKTPWASFAAPAHQHGRYNLNLFSAQAMTECETLGILYLPALLASTPIQQKN